MKLKNFLLVLLALVLVLAVGCGQKEENNGVAQLNQDQGAVADQNKTGQESQPADNIPPVTARKVTATIETNKGTIIMDLYNQDAPKTVANFVKLAKEGFYDGLKWHRYEPGFVIQGGDPNGDGTGGPGYQIKFEPNSRKHVRGAVGMARGRDLDSAGSQFYICLQDQPGLDGDYVVFGQVTQGMDVVDQLRAGDRMIKVTITESN